MVVFLLEKTFTKNKSYKDREQSDKIRLPKGVITQVSFRGEEGCADNIEWWLTIGGRRFFPYECTKGTYGLNSKTCLAAVDEHFPIRQRGLDIRLVGFNTKADTDYWLQALVTVIPEQEMPAGKKE